MNLITVVPTRDRPEAVSEIFKCLNDTNYTGTILFCVDDDDPKRQQYFSKFDNAKLSKTYGAQMVSGPRLRCVGTLNKVVPTLVDSGKYDIIGFMGDDHRPRTHNFDKKIESALADETGYAIAYGDDLLQGQNLPTAAWIRTDLIKSLGAFVPPKLKHLYFDDTHKTIGTELGVLIYLPEVVIEHMHPAAGKAEWSDQYRELNSHAMYDHDSKEFARWKQDDWPALKAKVVADGFGQTGLWDALEL